MKLIKKLLYKYVYQDWNIAIAERDEELNLHNIKWIKHTYKDRWFADPFIIDDTPEAYIILVEEYLHETRRGRLARLTVCKKDCTLLNNETILDIDTHLSFPNPMEVDGQIYIYPENGAAGNTKYYMYGQSLKEAGIISKLPLADATIHKIGEVYYMFATIGKECNGSTLSIYRSDNALGPFEKSQEIHLKDNTARRAGNTFEWQDKIISPAQICNNDYGEGVCLQQISFEDGKITLLEVKRMMPPTKKYPEGFHTYNVYKDNIVVIDGYRYGSKFLHDIYFKVRK